MGSLPRGPRIECVQPAGNNTVAGPLRDGAERATPAEWTTKISGLQCASILDGHELIAAALGSGGTGHLVSDEQIWAAQARLAREEGVYCEPAGAAALAGALHALDRDELDRQAFIVCLVTGAAFKDPPSIGKMAGAAEVPTISVDELSSRR